MRRHLAAAFVLGLAALAPAEDVLILENGREARGRIVEETEAGVKLDFGAGKMFYAKKLIREIRRGTPDGAAAETPPLGEVADAREESALLYQDGRRVGTRVCRAAKTREGWRFEEEIVFLDDKGVPEMQVRTTERSDAEFLPLAFQFRETAGSDEHRMVAGEVRGGRLYVTVTKAGEKTQSDDALPAGARFPFAAREFFLRDAKALAGKLEAPVFDTRDQRWRTTSYAEAGRKPVDENGATFDLRVIVRRRDEVMEREWVDDKLSAHMSELNGEALRAIRSSQDVIGRVKQGDTERVTGKDSAARTRYVDPEGGWRIGKPDPSWTFEEPAVRGAGALLSIRNAAIFASVDVLHDRTAPPDTTVERAAESLQRLCRAVAEDFHVERDGYTGEGPFRIYWLEATATTKGEKTRTLANVLVRKGKVFRLLAACPDKEFALLRSDLERILGSFVAE
jgi:hypothetical protein